VTGGSVSGGPTYEANVSLEVHVELKTVTKVFCACPNAFGGLPNTRVCPVCLGLPGSLPVLNRAALEYAVRAALALNCEVAATTVFARKNYFYPDLPKGYQISQADNPVGSDGFVEFEGPGGGAKRVRIQRVHLEEDAGKSFHLGGEDDAPATPGGDAPATPATASATPAVAFASTSGTGDHSLLDFNRCGVPLMEIVSGIDLSSGEEARAYLNKLYSILSYLGISDLKIEEGSLRCDANVSIRPRGRAELGTRAEVKNIGSFRGVKLAIDHEIERQCTLLEEGRTVSLETRRWDERRARTTLLRSKAEANDYRYFPEPDLVPIAITPSWVEEIRRSLPELPDARRARLILDHQLPPSTAQVISASPALAAFYENGAALADDRRAFANWLIGDFLALLNASGRPLEAAPVPAGNLAALVNLVGKGVVSGKIGKTVLEAMFSAGRTAEDIIREQRLVQITDAHALAAVVAEVMAANPGPVADYVAGKTQALGFLVGQVMKATRGQASPELVNRLLRETLEAP
jgi:aspartyl-tRNA(Asn)/glutamyl-tRNA(Gln) amidotransferase subunit B